LPRSFVRVTVTEDWIEAGSPEADEDERPYVEGTYADRFPPDAPVVPNESWRDIEPRGVPRRCGRLRRRHLWTRPEPYLPRWVCARCHVASYMRPSPRW
jgi:hypothetical protein